MASKKLNKEEKKLLERIYNEYVLSVIIAAISGGVALVYSIMENKVWMFALALVFGIGMYSGYKITRRLKELGLIEFEEEDF